MFRIHNQHNYEIRILHNSFRFRWLLKEIVLQAVVVAVAAVARNKAKKVKKKKKRRTKIMQCIFVQTVIKVYIFKVHRTTAFLPLLRFYLIFSNLNCITLLLSFLQFSFEKKEYRNSDQQTATCATEWKGAKVMMSLLLNDCSFIVFVTIFI